MTVSGLPFREDDVDHLSSFDQVLSKHLLDIMIFLGGMQIMFAMFAFVDRLNPTVASKFVIVDVFADGKFWAGCFLFSGILSIIAVKRATIRAVSTALSAAAFGVWGLLCVIKSFSAISPIAWSIGFAVLACAWVSYKLCLIWGLVEFDPSKIAPK